MRNYSVTIALIEWRIAKIKGERDELNEIYLRAQKNSEEWTRKAFNLKAALQESEDEVTTRAFLDSQSPRE